MSINSKTPNKEWEKVAITTRDPVNEAEFLKKYGGLMWQDEDNGNKILYSDKENIPCTLYMTIKMVVLDTVSEPVIQSTDTRIRIKRHMWN
jgi:hypothetical protein